MSCTLDRFKHDVAKHKLQVVRDDGMFRHLVMKKPDSSDLHFNITTWPGYLCISGDMGCFVFNRLPDMFSFFRTDAGCINPGYWQEKLQAGAGYNGARAISEEPDLSAFDDRIKQYLDDFIESLDPEDEENAEKIADATEAVNDFIENRDNEEFDVLYRIRDWDPSLAGGLELDDFFDFRLDKYRFHYIWCCYAIVHAIALYDAAKAEEVAA